MERMGLTPDWIIQVNFGSLRCLASWCGPVASWEDLAGGRISKESLADARMLVGQMSLASANRRVAVYTVMQLPHPCSAQPYIKCLNGDSIWALLA